MRKLNNRGYMLVEIILASVLAFGMAYFMISMTVNLKNKNDDMLVETLTATDQAIIANAIMSSLKGKNCDTIKNNNLLQISGQKVTVNGSVVDIVNDYATITLNDDFCTSTHSIRYGNDVTAIHINIPISVKQIPDRNFNIKLDWIEKNG